MSTLRRFAIDLECNDARIVSDFRAFVARMGASDVGTISAAETFDSSVTPHLKGMREIVSRGGNVDFSKSLDTELGPVMIEVTTAKLGLVERLLKIVRG
jgi:hypothetical protein